MPIGLRGHVHADLRLCVTHMSKEGFLMKRHMWCNYNVIQDKLVSFSIPN